MSPRRLLPLLVALALLSLAAVPPLPSPSPSPGPGTAAESQLIDEVRARLSGDLATVLVAQMQLSEVLRQNAEQQQAGGQALAATNARLAELDASIRARQAEMVAAQARIDADRAQMAALARALYRQPSSQVEQLALAGSLHEVLTRTADLEAAGRRARELKAAVARELADLRAAQERQRAEREQQADIRAGQQRTLDALRQLRDQEERTSAALAAAIERTRARIVDVGGGQQAGLAGRLRQELDAEQASITAAAEQEAWSQAAIGLQAGIHSSASRSAGHSTRTRFIWPLPRSVLTQGFGPTDFALEPAHAGYAHFHTGLDIAAPFGTPVLAADDGVVATAATGTTGYGNYVVIAHADGLSTLYGHLAAALVKPGQQVVQGQPIGLEGSTGNSTGPHTHFELRVSGLPVDPTPFLPAGGPSASRA
jgi:murein DD-endopeptidase MepM/ murein hydrolase activator NlpD